MTKRGYLCAAAAALVIGFGQPAVAQSAGEGESDVLVQKVAVDALGKMASYLGKLTTFKLTAIGSSDDVLTDNGQKLQIQGQVDFVVRQPDGLKAHITTDKQERVIYYDGHTVTQYAPALDYYAVVDAPPTIAETVLALEKDYGLRMPLADVFLWGHEHQPKVDILAAYFVGRSTILGDRCDHYAYRVEGADVQIWIRTEGPPLPCRMVITNLTDEARPEFEATLIWNTDADVGNSEFSFAPPESAAKIEQAKTDQADN